MSRFSCVRKNEHYCLTWSQILGRQRGLFSPPNSVMEAAGKRWDFKNCNLNVLLTKQAESPTSLNVHLYFARKEMQKGKNFKLSFGPVKDKDPCNTISIESFGFGY